MFATECSRQNLRLAGACAIAFCAVEGQKPEPRKVKRRSPATGCNTWPR